MSNLEQCRRSTTTSTQLRAMRNTSSGPVDLNLERKMSDPFRKSSTPPLDETKQRKLDKFMNERNEWFITEDSDIANRDLPETPTKSSANEQTRSNCQQPADMDKSSSSKGKTPIRAAAKVPQAPVRKSARTGTKRKVFENSDAGAKERSPSPLAKKPRTGKVTACASLEDTDESTDNNTSTKAPRTPKKKALAPLTNASTSQAGPSKKRLRVADDDLDSDEPPKAKKGKARSLSEEEFKNFEATANSNGKGSSSSGPQHAQLEKPWKCANRMCATGMTWFKRGNGTGTDGFGRKACSHWFGRNKRETGYIDNEVWHWFCRKCYQRSQYQAKSKKTESTGNILVKRHVDTLRMQIIRLQFWRPRMTFKIQLLKGAKDRLAQYHKVINRPGASEFDAIEAVEFVATTTSNGKEKKPRAEHEFPIKLIEHFDYTYVGKGKTYNDLTEICKWIDDLNEDGEAPCDPPVEFLPSALAEDELVVDPIGPPDNYDRWTAYCDAAAEQSPASEGEDDQEHDGDDTEDERTYAGALYKKSLSDSEDDGEDDEDDAPPARKAPPKSSSGLTYTALGRALGTKGKAGIFSGSGIREEREAVQSIEGPEGVASKRPESRVKHAE